MTDGFGYRFPGNRERLVQARLPSVAANSFSVFRLCLGGFLDCLGKKTITVRTFALLTMVGPGAIPRRRIPQHYLSADIAKEYRGIERNHGTALFRRFGNQ